MEGYYLIKGQVIKIVKSGFKLDDGSDLYCDRKSMNYDYNRDVYTEKELKKFPKVAGKPRTIRPPTVKPEPVNQDHDAFVVVIFFIAIAIIVAVIVAAGV